MSGINLFKPFKKVIRWMQNQESNFYFSFTSMMFLN